MAQSLELIPRAGALVLSLRDLGYSFETAIADIVDNSIAARATRIDIVCDLTLAAPALSILDNGTGMNEEALLLALCHGSKGPKAKRDPRDLGRFGLGLKTASFSQARRLTVASRTGERLVAAEWNLDRIETEDNWMLDVLDRQEIETIPQIEQLNETGTLVVWRSLDRLFEHEEGMHREEIVNEKLALVRDHLSLVFHRFLDGDTPYGKIRITVNGSELQPFDPFCTSNKATQKLPMDVVKLNGHRITIQPYILPHHSRLGQREYEFYKSRSDFLSNQGAYVYRNFRLMAWGDWFRLVPKGEATKLGRVQIDFPSDLDEAWTIDIKKSRARPPRIVREQLRQILNQITGAAVRVHRGRGQRLYQEIESPIWERFADQGQIRYAVSKSHPIVVRLLGLLDDNGQQNLVALLESVAAALPMDLLYSDYSNDPKAFSSPESNEEEAIDRLRALKLALFADQEFNAEQFIKIVYSTRLYDDRQPLVEKFAKGEIT